MLFSLLRISSLPHLLKAELLFVLLGKKQLGHLLITSFLTSPRGAPSLGSHNLCASLHHSHDDPHHACQVPFTCVACFWVYPPPCVTLQTCSHRRMQAVKRDVLEYMRLEPEGLIISGPTLSQLIKPQRVLTPCLRTYVLIPFHTYLPTTLEVSEENPLSF